MEGIWLIAFLVQWALVLFLGLLVIGILRQLSVMQQRWNMAAPPVTALEIGDELPDITLPDWYGSMVSVKAHLCHRGGVVLILSAGCSACRTLVERLSQLEQVRNNGSATDGSLVVIMLGDRAEAHSLLDELTCKLPQLAVVFDADGLVSRQLAIVAVPTGIAVDEGGHVVSQTFNPHVGQWLYKALKVRAPAQEAQTLVSVVAPVIYAQRREQG